MKASLITIFALISSFAISQNLEVEGKAKINQFDRDDLADSVIVKVQDGTLGIRLASTLNEFQVISISNDTIYLSGGGFVKLPPDGAAGWIMKNDTTSTLKNVVIGSKSVDGNLEVRGETKLQGLVAISDSYDTSSIYIGINAGINAPAYYSQNTIVGTDAGRMSYWGLANSFFGYKSGELNTTGGSNSFFGFLSGLGNSTGYNNSFFGSAAGSNNTTGTSNSCFGNSAGYSLVSGFDNSFFGYQAGLNTNYGRYNSFLGNGAGAGNTTGSHNSFVGSGSGVGNSTGSYSVSIGNASGYGSNGSYNTFLGAHAGYFNETGNNLICIGWYSQPSSSSTSNEITLGNDTTNTLRCNVNYITSLSDQRDKTDIQDLTTSIDFIMTLKPRQYRWDRRDWYVDRKTDGTKKDSTFTAGFIAQELDEAQTTQEVKWLDLVLKSNPDRLEATPGNLFPVIVKSLQDLKRENDQLKKDSKLMQGKIDNLHSKFNDLTDLVRSSL
ncbi:MAG: tail fiber domain-containing protein [Saprospiraceae bacterium]|nr:tail fiber domain-containing protein [Saprospiraceae bacterium]